MTKATFRQHTPHPSEADKIFSSQSQRSLEAEYFDSHPVESTHLIDIASKGAFDIIEASLALKSENESENEIKTNLNTDKQSKPRILFLCGKGGNGADGLSCSHLFFKKGYAPTTVLMFKKDELSNQALAVLTRCQKAGQTIDSSAADELDFASFDVIVDAVFGAGFKNKQNIQSINQSNNQSNGLSEKLHRLFLKVEHSRRQGTKLIAFDCPSGVNVDLIHQHPPVHNADITVAFGYKKPLHISQQGTKICGKIHLVTLGLSSQMSADKRHSNLNKGWKKPLFLKPDAVEIGKHLFDLLPPRDNTAHKFDFGHVFIIGGSESMLGAVCLSARAALKVGAGMVSVIIPRQVSAYYPKFPDEVMVHTLKGDGYFTEQHIDDCLSLLSEKKATTVALGMGLGKKDESIRFIKKIIEKSLLPTVVDAQGLAALNTVGAAHLDPERIIATPHPGEFGRYLSPTNSLPCFLDDIKSVAQTFSCTIIYKSACPVIAHPTHTPEVLVQPTSSLSKAGSGDVLAGIVAGLWAQKQITTALVAKSAVILHNLAGQESAKRLTEYAVSASDLIKHIPHAMKKLAITH